MAPTVSGSPVRRNLARIARTDKAVNDGLEEVARHFAVVVANVSQRYHFFVDIAFAGHRTADIDINLLAGCACGSKFLHRRTRRLLRVGGDKHVGVRQQPAVGRVDLRGEQYVRSRLSVVVVRVENVSKGNAYRLLARVRVERDYKVSVADGDGVHHTVLDEGGGVERKELRRAVLEHNRVARRVVCRGIHYARGVGLTAG